MKFKQVLVETHHLLQLSAKNNCLLYLMILNSLTTSIIPFVNLYFSMLILDSVLYQSFDLTFTYAIVMIVLSFILDCISKFTSQRLIAKYRFCNNLVTQDTISKSFTIEFDELEKIETIEKLNYLDNGINGAGDVGSQLHDINLCIQYAFTTFFSLIFVVILFLHVPLDASYFFTSPLSTIIMILLFLLLIMIIFKLQKISSQKINEMQRSNISTNSKSSYIFNVLLDLNQSLDIRLNKLNHVIQTNYLKYKKNSLPMYLQWGIVFGRYNALSSLLVELYAGLTYIFVCAKAYYGIISLGSVLMYTGAISQFIVSVQKFISTFASITYRFEYLHIHSDFIHHPNIHYHGTLPIEKRNDFEYEFECRNVSFKYPNTEFYVLENVSLQFNIGQRHAIVGQNGAGKTTLIKLLCRLYIPTSGTIYLNGIDIQKYDFDEYIKIFSVVFQDYQLFSFPINENIAGSSNPINEKVHNILSNIHILDTINNLPEGIVSTLYKDNTDGVILSGGQSQKLSIARALYKNAPFIILDEPTAALDPISESETYLEFNQLVGGKTSIFISHRMSSCIFCDKIFVFDHGKLISQGNHVELLKSCDIYNQLWHAQSKHYQHIISE